MLQLPLLKSINYFSPTSYQQACACEYSFYRERHSETPYIRLPQTKPMAVGYAFESFVKAELAFVLGKSNDRKNTLAKLLENVEEHNLECIAIGHDLFDKYQFWGCFDRLVKDGLHDIELSIHQTVQGELVAGKEGEVSGVPIFGKPDATMLNRGDNSLIPTDWKVNGHGSATGQSPKPGYIRCFVDGQDKGQHITYGIATLEQINREWAIQLLFYNWMLGNKSPFFGAIEQVAIRGNTVAFTSYRARISDDFIQEHLSRLIDLWGRFNKGQFAEPEPGQWKCEPYGFPRVCTVTCEAYARTLGDPGIRGVMKGV